MPKQLIIDLPYPNIDDVAVDKKSAAIISPSFSGGHGELNATLQYVYHHFNFSEQKDGENAEILMSIAVAEMKHLELLGELLIRLGVDPIYTRFPPYKNDFYTAAGVSYSKTPQKMLLDDVTAEMLAIKDYSKMLLELENEKVAAVIKRIILDEELHLKVLKERFVKISGNGGFFNGI